MTPHAWQVGDYALCMDDHDGAGFLHTNSVYRVDRVAILPGDPTPYLLLHGSAVLWDSGRFRITQVPF